MRTGQFIAFEGGEGAGKSTQTRLLAQALRARGIEVVTTREPGGTPGAEAIRSLLLDGVEGDEAGWGPRAEALLFAAARADHVDRLIRPALARGAWVICDRFLDSSRAYQGGGSGLSDGDILTLHRIGSEGLMPDRTLLITVAPEEAMRRLAQRDVDGSDRIGGRDPAFHARVNATFATFAEEEASRFARIDGNGTPEAIHQRVLDALASLLGEPGDARG
ncbi:dTMP kinase [Novosphingobium sp. 1949]|uniref:Thymidylate kinase n=1 Tax=Novosphingobium organovorum TaxID=2930092 RepID=A0ABT0B8L0_9SPHN|nr:dTMP kinase [Novosphingobium organovorum]MCJ2181402.1 dTMP kinase [Novosphingobium organovorum]